MTDVTPLLGAGAQVIETYTNRGFRVSGVEYLGAIVIVNDKVLPLEVKMLNELSVQSLSMLGGEEVFLHGDFRLDLFRCQAVLARAF